MLSSATIQRPWGVTAFGQGNVHAPPDYALLRLAINRTANVPNDALRAAREAAAAVQAAARSLGIATSDVTSSRTTVRTEWRGFGEGRTFVGHACRVEFGIRLDDLELVDQTLIVLVDAGADEILGVSYDTRRTPELRADARRAAIDAARRKAALYAEAAGAALGPVVHIEDIDPALLRGDSHALLLATTTDESTLAPGSITVSAAVLLGFSLRS